MPIGENQIVYVNSNDRLSGTSSNFSYLIRLDANMYDRVSVLQAYIPKSYYLISPTNCRFTLIENGVSIPITLTYGNYSRRSLATAVKTKLNAATQNSITYNVTYPNSVTEPDTGKYTITSSNVSLSIALSFTNEVYEQLGFDAHSTNLFSGGSLTSTNVIKISSEDTIQIHSDLCSNANNNILQEVYTGGTGNFSAIIFENKCPEAYSKAITTDTDNSYNFWISDENGHPIELNGQNCVFTLLLYKSTDVSKVVTDYVTYRMMDS